MGKQMRASHKNQAHIDPSPHPADGRTWVEDDSGLLDVSQTLRAPKDAQLYILTVFGQWLVAAPNCAVTTAPRAETAVGPREPLLLIQNPGGVTQTSIPLGLVAAVGADIDAVRDEANAAIVRRVYH